MVRNVKRVAQSLCNELEEQLAQKKKQLEEIRKQLAEVREELKILSTPLSYESQEVRPQLTSLQKLGLYSSDTIGIADEKLRMQYLKCILDPRKQQEEKLEKQLSQMQDEIPSFQEALERAIDAVGHLQYAIAKLGNLGFHKERIVDAWNKVKIGQELNEEESTAECLKKLFGFLMKQDISKEDIEREWDRLKDEGYF